MISLSPNSTVAVAVNLQDVFFSQPSTTQSDGEKSCPIAPATWRRWFQTWLQILEPDIPQAKAYEVSVRLTDDGEIQTLNGQYRDRHQATDVLSFAAMEVNFPQPPADFLAEEPLYLGDIVISVDTANRQAKQHGHSLSTELAWLASHGFLHLLGWDHPDEESLINMLSQQETLLKVVGIPKATQVPSQQLAQPNRTLAWRIAPNLLISFQYAWAGVRYAFITQRNFRIHTAIAILAISLGVFLRITAVEMSIVGLTCALVMVLELLNTALESVVDLTVGQHYHELAKIAKDCAAGAVLISALAAVLVASYVLVPPLLAVIVSSGHS